MLGLALEKRSVLGLTTDALVLAECLQRNKLELVLTAWSDAFEYLSAVFWRDFVWELRSVGCLLVQHSYRSTDRDVLPNTLYILLSLTETKSFFGPYFGHFLHQTNQIRWINLSELLKVSLQLFLVECERKVVFRHVEIVPSGGIEEHRLKSNHPDPEHIHLFKVYSC